MPNHLLKKPLVALRGMVVLPGMIVNLDIGREKSMRAVDEALAADRMLLLAAQIDSDQIEVKPANLHHFAVLVQVKQKLTLPNGAIRILVEVLERVVLESIEDTGSNSVPFYGVGEIVSDDEPADTETLALQRLLLEAFEKWVLQSKKVNADVLQGFKNEKDPGKVADLMVGYLTISLEEKQELLELVALNPRIKAIYTIITRELEITDIAKKVSDEVHAAIEKNQREYYLREQIKVISKELGDAEDIEQEIAEYREKMSKLQLSEEAEAKVEKELSRLRKMQPMTPETAVVRTYVDNVLALPWGIEASENFDIKKAEKILDNDHYGLKKVKERIVEYLAVRALTESSKGPILCLVGPPGVGKTSLAQSIANAVGRKFTRVSLGGVRDEAEIRGHRRTYIGALPGRIIHGMQNCGCMNPVFLLDEIDKLNADFRGDPASALLEALDPEQNHSFSDHFIELPFDLSKVFWIVTANTKETIPPALLDRMEVIELSSYTELEKLAIAKRHLLPKAKKENGLEKYRVVVSDKALRRVIRDYTREAGVRNLERKLNGICRRVAYNIIHDEAKGAQVSDKNIEKYLGPVIFLEEDYDVSAQVGSVNGLAWTSVGGEILKVEVLTYPGKGALTLTGQLGDVMKESAQAGFTYIKSRAQELGLKADFAETTDIHIHLPEGAVPKDGPSAGDTMITAMVSALTGRKVKAKLAMTGEITLSGRVLPVGGIKEKMLAAYRYGVKTVLLPKRNLQDLDELPAEVRESMSFIGVNHMDEVLQEALEPLE